MSEQRKRKSEKGWAPVNQTEHEDLKERVAELEAWRSFISGQMSQTANIGQLTSLEDLHDELRNRMVAQEASIELQRVSLESMNHRLQKVESPNWMRTKKKGVSDG